MAQHSWPRLLELVRASIPEIEDAGQADGEGSHCRIQGGGNQVARRHFRVGWQSVDFRLVNQQIERVESAEHFLVGAVEIRPALAGPVQLLDPCLRPFSKLSYGSKLDRLRRAGLRAGGLHATLQPVVTER